MKKVGEGVKEIIAALAGGSDEASQKAARAAAVNVLWRNAVEAVYKDAAQTVLDHINAVYIMSGDACIGGQRDGITRKQGAQITTSYGARSQSRGAQIVIYADDSLIRSDLDARQEFLKMRLKEQGEHIDTFKILPSRFDMKARHPFKNVSSGEQKEHQENEESEFPTLTTDQLTALEEEAQKVENSSVQQALLNALRASTQQKNNIK
ncbi:hypothetical protein [Eggerthella sp. YY7918]|uniref:hypothetical protein n=1 Tax=Eggerthella sp. (strain YY7918) TaxID=502558 RepID=UPI0002170F6E|nr:hypothetical protein [Eggerthella sp. YY7918]BAK43291.1 3'-phosphoadenosine 5'-phosphosulfate sulfotransferase [Eggerthella sp. YY7918]